MNHQRWHIHVHMNRAKYLDFGEQEAPVASRGALHAQLLFSDFPDFTRQVKVRVVSEGLAINDSATGFTAN